MKIAVVAATGKAGRKIVKEAADRGWDPDPLTMDAATGEFKTANGEAVAVPMAK